MLVMAMGATYIVAKERPTDPMYAEIEAFEKAVDAAFKPKEIDAGKVMQDGVLNIQNLLAEASKDSTLPNGSKELIRLQDQFLKMRIRLEQVSTERKDFLVEDPWTYSLAEISLRYLKQLRRLMLNNYRNAHSKIGEEKNYTAQFYDYLSPRMNGQVGVSLLQNDRKLEKIFDYLTAIRFMVSHVRDINTGAYDRVLIAFTPQDKDQMEQEVLISDTSLQGYAKTIHFFATRARIINQYSLQRMEMPITDTMFNVVLFSNLKDPELNSCGENFISFRQPAIDGRGDDYYHALLKEDRYHDYEAHVKGGLMQLATFDEPVISQAQLGRVLSKFVFALPDFDMMLDEFSGDMSMTDTPDEKQNAENLRIKKQKADEKLTNEFSPSILKALETAWQAQAEKTLLLANYIADSWDPVTVADRIAWTAWETRKKMLLSALVNEVIDEQLAGTVVVTKDNSREEILLGMARKALETELTREQETAWRTKVRTNILNYMKSPSAKTIIENRQARRFDEQFDFMWNSIQSGAKAGYVRKLTDKLRREHIGAEVDRAWKDDSDAFNARWSHKLVNLMTVVPRTFAKMFGARPSQFYTVLFNLTQNDIGGVILPARGLMDARVHPYTPDQLSQYFTKKLNFWKEQKNFPELQKRAIEISSNVAVTKGLEFFFSKVSENFAASVEAQKLKAKDLGPDNPLLYRSIEAAIKPAFEEFRTLMETNPPVPTHWEVYAADRDKQVKWSRELEKDIYNRYTWTTRHALPGVIFVDLEDPNWRDNAKKESSKDKLVFIVADKTFEPTPEDARLFDAIVSYPFKLADLYPKLRLKISEARKLYWLGRNFEEGQRNRADGTYLRPKIDPSKFLPAPKTEYTAPAQRAEVTDLFMDALSMMGLSRHFFNRTSHEMIPTKFSMRTFLKIESMFDQGGVEKKLENRIAMSILDQKILADILYQVALAEHPMLTIQPQGGVSDPNGLDFIVSTYDPKTGVNRARAMESVKGFVSLAASLQKRLDLVGEACRAKPFQEKNPDWRNVFRSASGTRALFKGINPALKEHDEVLMKSTRTTAEVWMDRLDEVAKWTFYAMMIVMAVGLAWTGVGAIAGAVALGSFKLGAAILLEAAGTAVGAVVTKYTTAWTRKFIATAIGKFVTYVFTAQIVMMGYVNCWHLPPHARYLMGVGNSEVGIHTQVTSDRNAIRAYANQLYLQQALFVPFALLQTTMVRPILRDIKTIFGMPIYKKSLERMGSKGAESLTNQMKAKSLKEWIAQEGSIVSGMKAWGKQTGNSLWKTWHVAAVGEQATIQQLNAAMAPRLMQVFPSTAMYETFVEGQMAAKNKVGAKLYSWILKAHENPAWHTEFKVWVRAQMAKYVLRGKYLNFAMTEAATKRMGAIVNGAAMELPQHHVFWEVYARAYLADILNDRGYWELMLETLNTMKAELAVQGTSDKDIMRVFLQRFSPADIHQHKKLMDWVLTQKSGRIGGFIRGYTDENVIELKRMFADYENLAKEIAGLAPKVVEEADKVAADFALFGLTKEATAEELKKAYRRETRNYHWDTGKAAENGLTKEEADEKFKEIAAAKERLDKWFEEQKQAAGEATRNSGAAPSEPKQQLLLGNGNATNSAENELKVEMGTARDPKEKRTIDWSRVGEDVEYEAVEGEYVLVIELDQLTGEPRIVLNKPFEAKRKKYNIFKVMKERFGIKD